MLSGAPLVNRLASLATTLQRFRCRLDSVSATTRCIRLRGLVLRREGVDNEERRRRCPQREEREPEKEPDSPCRAF